VTAPTLEVNLDAVVFTTCDNITHSQLADLRAVFLQRVALNTSLSADDIEVEVTCTTRPAAQNIDPDALDNNDNGLRRRRDRRRQLLPGAQLSSSSSSSARSSSRSLLQSDASNSAVLSFNIRIRNHLGSEKPIVAAVVNDLVAAGALEKGILNVLGESLCYTECS
jgi:hypothetical protein